MFFAIFFSAGFMLFSQTEIIMPGLNDSLWTIPSFGVVPLSANPAAETTTAESTEKETPLWVKDLRRAEIVMFGSVPFTIFFTSFFMDFYRMFYYAGGWDSRYAPWPFKGTGAIDKTTSELTVMFTVAISGSLIIAAADYFIVRHKRIKAQSEETPVPDPGIRRIPRTEGD
jgi:hypothetical protein